MAAESDEELARQLQAEFDAEEVQFQQQMMTDARIAASVAKAHELSDSESDSDATIEPPGYNSSLDGSQDLFDTTSGSSSFNRSWKSASSSSPGTLSSMMRHKNPCKLSKAVSKTHTLSDSESDSAVETRHSKEDEKHYKKSVSQSSSHKSIHSGAEPAEKQQSRQSSVVFSGASLHAQNSKHGVKLTSKPSTVSSNVFSFQSKQSATSSGKKYSIPKLTSTSPVGAFINDNTSSSGSSSKYTIPKQNSSCSGSKAPVTSVRHSSVGSEKCNSFPSQHGPDDASSASGPSNSNNKPPCKYGDRCYRTNTDHLQNFHHGEERNGKRKPLPMCDRDVDVEKKKPKTEKAVSANKTVADVVSESQPLSFFLTKVRGIDDRFNDTGAVSIKDILSPLMGNLQASCQFNFMIDIPWLVQQYPREFREKPLLLVHGEQGRSETELKEEGARFPHISYCKAKLEIMYGTHHTKMMLLLYDHGMRVVIHTANLIENDWHQKTQGVWISPLFPKLSEGGGASSAFSKTVQGDSKTNFKRDLLAYLAAYNVVPLKQWEMHIQQHDFSAARVYIIGSIPGRHSGDRKSAWGHMKLRKVLQEAGPEKKEFGSWPVYGQFSSIGSLGASPDQWLCDEWLSSLGQCQGIMSTPLHHTKLKLVYPSKENVRLCLEGYAGGGCLPYSINTGKKQIYLNNFLRKWGSEGRGRTGAIPHIKTYTRVSPDFKQAAWFLVTSANLSKAAWGALEKQKTQLMIRSYEIGVLFLPSHFGCGGSFPIAKTAEEGVDSDEVMFPFPYDMPPPEYQKGDRIWMWDVPCVDLPDTHGKKYCPKL